MEKGLSPEKLYNLDTVAEILGITKRTLLDAIRRDELKAIKKHRRYFVLGKDVIEYLQK